MPSRQVLSRPGTAASAHEGVLRLQGAVGNAATQRVVAPAPLSGTTSTPRALPPVAVPSSDPGGALAAAAGDLHRHWAGLGTGDPVPASLRAPHESSFGVDLSPARMHVGTPAARGVTTTLGVQALTAGNHMLFAAAPDSRVLGHELAHVVQQGLRGGPAANSAVRAAAPGSDAERDADVAAHAVAAGRPHRLRPAGGEDVHLLAPLAWLAIAALVAGGGIAVTAELAGPSYEENRRRAEERRRDPSVAAWAEATWLWVPVGGTATRIWQAESRLERYLNVAMMPLDVLTLGALWSAGAKITSTGLWRTAVTRAAPEELAALGRQGVSVATRAEVQASARAALEAGKAVVATVGRRNHALVFVMVEGQLYRLTGGALRSMAVRSMASFAPRSINAFHVLGGTQASARILAEAQMLARTLGPGLGFSFRSCGLSTARLAETGLLSVGQAGLGLGGGRAFLPVTVMGALAERGGIMMSQQGARNMLLGSGLQFGLIATARSAVTVMANPEGFASSLVHLLVPGATDLEPVQSSADDPAHDPLTELEATQADVDAAVLDESEPADGIDVGSVTTAYTMIQNRRALQAGGEPNASHQLELEPVYTFLATAEDNASIAHHPVSPSEVVDLTAAADTEPGADADRDHDWLLHLSGEPEYVDGALRFVDDLRACVDSEGHARVLDAVGSYFPASSPRPGERAAAAGLALERAGLSGEDLEAARSRLALSGG
ncbi:eCIS core domain-containing protein [Thalassiella azotivora]